MESCFLFFWIWQKWKDGSHWILRWDGIDLWNIYFLLIFCLVTPRDPAIEWLIFLRNLQTRSKCIRLETWWAWSSLNANFSQKYSFFWIKCLQEPYFQEVHFPGYFSFLQTESDQSAQDAFKLIFVDKMVTYTTS